MNLEISIEHEPWQKIDVKNVVDTCVNCVFSELKLNHNNIEICFLFTKDEEVKILNKTYRGINKSTNVLSFPADPIDNQSYEDCNIDKENVVSKPCILGSIAFAYETVKTEVVDQQKTFLDHLKHLIVHSILHLLGYDHNNENSTKNMENLEIKLLKKLNVRNPYE